MRNGKQLTTRATSKHEFYSVQKWGDALAEERIVDPAVVRAALERLEVED